MLGESFDVSVILGGIKLQGLAAELAGLPILVERVLQEVFLCDCGVQPVEKFGVGHEYLQPRGERGATVEPRIVADSGFVCWWAARLGAGGVDAGDVGADAAELFYYAFVAAVDVVDAVDDGFAAGD